MIIMLRMPETNKRGRVISSANHVYCAACPPGLGGVSLSDGWYVTSSSEMAMQPPQVLSWA